MIKKYQGGERPAGGKAQGSGKVLESESVGIPGLNSVLRAIYTTSDPNFLFFPTRADAGVGVGVGEGVNNCCVLQMVAKIKSNQQMDVKCLVNCAELLTV